jgi:hypothetical protein
VKAKVRKDNEMKGHQVKRNEVGGKKIIKRIVK